VTTSDSSPPPDETLSLADERRALALLAEAVRLGDEEREALLAASDLVVASQVRALLAAGRGAGTPSTGTPSPSAGSGGGPVAELLPPGTGLGPYRILQALGAGGMGQVYLAEQTEPIERRVALKVLQLGAAQPWARRRFSAERRAMARLDHPNVAKILDAGTAADGTLYLAMERLEGVAITTYCDEHRLSIEARLDLGPAGAHQAAGGAHRAGDQDEEHQSGGDGGRPVPEDVKLRADVLTNLGRQQRLAGELEASEASYRQAIDMYTQVSDLGDLDLAAAITNLGVLYFAENRWADAEAQFSRALPILRDRLPPGHTRIATIQGNLAAAVASQGRLAEAAPIFESTLADQRAILGDDHPRVADSLNNLGVLYQDLGEPEKAVTYHRQALAIREKVLGPDNTYTAWSLDNLARALDELGRDEEALPLQRRALAIRESRETPAPLQVARSLEHLARLAMERGDYAEAMPKAERVLAIRRDALPPGDSRVGEDAVRVGECLWHLGRRDEARERFAEGLALIEAGGVQSADELAAARQTVAALGAG